MQTSRSTENLRNVLIFIPNKSMNELIEQLIVVFDIQIVKVKSQKEPR